MTPLTWRCLTPGCTATGTTDAGAARHTKETLHATITEVLAECGAEPPYYGNPCTRLFGHPGGHGNADRSWMA